MMPFDWTASLQIDLPFSSKFSLLRLVAGERMLGDETDVASSDDDVRVDDEDDLTRPGGVWLRYLLKNNNNP